MESNT
jgi:hypothetical protein